ncbi:MAG: FAD-dependent oxidoreductase, partial [Blastocatellia bacterium]|nr:FAD-dependent oxidoreductase [Blastocatellia bacterium]
LPREDDEAAALIAWQFQREKISVLTQVRLQRVTQRNADQVIAYEHNGQEKELLADVILVAAGRVPNIEDLGLDAAGISYTRDGVLVDDFLRTTNARVYAAGDVCSQYKFTHAADAMARMVLRNALFFGREKVGNLVMPWVTYTDPEVAHVGFYEESARAAEYDVATLTEHFADVDRAILDGEEEGFARVHYDRRTGRILGGTIVARHAGEMISELTLAITQGLKLAAL